MKTWLVVCSGMLFLGVADLPIGYYTLLRIVVTIGAVIVVANEMEKGFNGWVVTFGLIAILFNPLIPVYLHDKSAWVLIDLVVGALFLIKSLNTYKKYE